MELKIWSDNEWPYGKDFLKKRIWKEKIFLRNKKFSWPFHFIFAFCLLMIKAKILQKKLEKLREKIMQKFHEKNGNCGEKNKNFTKNAEFLKQTQNSNIYWSKGREFIYDIMKIKYWVIRADNSLSYLFSWKNAKFREKFAKCD